MSEWISVDEMNAPEGEVVSTKIHDKDGCRNEGTLKRVGNLWFIPSGVMYVYYQPTHWKPLSPPHNQ